MKTKISNFDSALEYLMNECKIVKDGKTTTKNHETYYH